MAAKVVNTSLLGWPGAARRGGRGGGGGGGGGGRVRERERLTFHSGHSGVEWVSAGRSCAQPLR